MRADSAHVAVAATSGVKAQAQQLAQSSAALPLLARLSSHSAKALNSSAALTAKFLGLVHSVFADRELRKTDAAHKLQFAFFAGQP